MQRKTQQETRLSLTNRATRLEASQGNRTWYHSICYIWFPIGVNVVHKTHRFFLEIRLQKMS